MYTTYGNNRGMCIIWCTLCVGLELPVAFRGQNTTTITSGMGVQKDRIVAKADQKWYDQHRFLLYEGAQG